MEVTYKWTDSIPWLSYHKDETACFWCPRCRISKNYSVNSMLDVLGDISVKSLPDVVSKAVGCKDFAKTGWDRCKMAPLPDRAFHKIEWMPEVKVPRGYLELGDTTVGAISEWQILHAQCRCGRLRYINRQELLRKFGPDAKTKDLEKMLNCRRCERRGWAIFVFRMEKR